MRKITWIYFMNTLRRILKIKLSLIIGISMSLLPSAKANGTSDLQCISFAVLNESKSIISFWCLLRKIIEFTKKMEKEKTEKKSMSWTTIVCLSALLRLSKRRHSSDLWAFRFLSGHMPCSIFNARILFLFRSLFRSISFVGRSNHFIPRVLENNTLEWKINTQLKKHICQTQRHITLWVDCVCVCVFSTSFIRITPWYGMNNIHGVKENFSHFTWTQTHFFYLFPHLRFNLLLQAVITW